MVKFIRKLLVYLIRRNVNALIIILFAISEINIYIYIFLLLNIIQIEQRNYGQRYKESRIKINSKATKSVSTKERRHLGNSSVLGAKQQRHDNKSSVRL